jgi:uncharacterized DUF497 family protein
LRKHGFDFADADLVFENEVYSIIDERFDYGETRFYTLGLLFGRVVSISHTEINDLIRIISMRKANKYGEEKYYKKIRN